MSTVARCFAGWLLLLSAAGQAALVQWYRLEEGAVDPATNLTHSAVSSSVGTLGGSVLPTWLTSGLAVVPPPGTTAAVYFSGATASAPKPYVATDFPGIAGGSPRTVAAWIKADTTQGLNPSVVHWGPGTPNGARFTFKLNPNSAGAGGWQIRLEVQGAGINGTKNVADGQWHHVAVVVTNNSNVVNAQLYVDGVRDPISPPGGGQAINTITNASNCLVIGNAGTALGGWDNSRGFAGLIDDVRIYDEALAASDILILVYGDGNAPTLNSSLSDQSIILGDTSASATFKVDAGGTPPLGFQWKFYGTNLLAETNDSLAINPATPANAGPYSVTVSNVFGTTNASANLLLNTAPIEPPQQVALVGGTASLSVTMPAGSTGYSYQWRKGGTNLPGATASSFLLSPTTLSDDSTNYTVVVMLAGVVVTSAPPATLRVLNPPASVYDAFVLGDGPAGYWRLGETNGAAVAVDETTFNPGVYSNYFGAELGVPGALINDTNAASNFGPDQNYVQVSYNRQLSRTNALTLEAWVKPASAGAKQSIMSCFGNLPVVGYELYLSPSGDCVFATSRNTSSSSEHWDTLDGGPVTLGVWTHLAAVLESGTKRIYTNGNLAGTQTAGMFAANGVPIRIGAGTTALAPTSFFNGAIDEPAIYGHTLSAARIQNHYLAGIVPTGTPPALETQPRNQKVILGDTNATATFSPVAVGFPPLEYQWQRNGFALPGQTNASLTIAAAGISGQATYSILVTNSAGWTQSSNALLSYMTAPVNPSAEAVLLGASASFNLAMPAYQTYQYQWKHAGTNLPGATAATFGVSEAAGADVGTYAVIAALGPDSAESDPATLTVIPLPSQPYSNAVAADAPVGWWRLNDPPGSSTAAEMSGLYPGTVYPDVRLGLDGALLGDSDTSAWFTGYSSDAHPGASRIEVSYAPQLNPSVFSVECWALVGGAAGTYRSPVTSRHSVSGYTAGYLFYAGDNNLWQFWLGTGTASFYEIIGPAVVENQWTHLVGTYEGANAAFYVNGNLVFSGPAAYVPNMLNQLSIGAGGTENFTGNFFFPGRVDEVAVYTNALSPAQVETHYAAAFPTSGVPRFTQQPLGRATLSGETYSLSAKVQSAPPVSFQWQHNGTNLSGATGSTLTLSPVESADEGAYQLIAHHGAETANSTSATLQVFDGEATSVNLEGYQGFHTITANGGYAGYVTLTNWSEIASNSTSGSAANFVNHKGQSSTMILSWSAANDRHWNGPFTVAKGDAGLLNGFLEAANTTNVLLSLSNIPTNYQDAGYSLYLYMGAPGAAVGIINPTDSFGAVSLGTVTNYYHAIDLAFWDGSFHPAITTDLFDPNPADANYVVFTNLNSPSLTVLVMPHSILGGPASLSGFQLVANVLKPVLLTVSQAGNVLVLTWPGHWVLQQESSLDASPGDWTDVPGAASPYPIPTPLAGQQYYRLRSP